MVDIEVVIFGGWEALSGNEVLWWDLRGWVKYTKLKTLVDLDLLVELFFTLKGFFFAKGIVGDYTHIVAYKS